LIRAPNKRLHLAAGAVRAQSGRVFNLAPAAGEARR
jgi:hypothetical protein